MTAMRFLRHEIGVCKFCGHKSCGHKSCGHNQVEVATG
jgi:hypothetical protein